MTSTPCVISAADHADWARFVCVAPPRSVPVTCFAGRGHRPVILVSRRRPAIREPLFPDTVETVRQSQSCNVRPTA